MLDFETLSTIAFILVLIALAIWDRKNIEFKYGVMMRKTKKGKKWLYNTGKKYKKILRVLGSVGIVVAFAASLLSIYFLLQSTYSILSKPKEAKPGVQLIIPKVPSKIVCTYALCVPFWYWIIGVLVVLFSHEMMHGLIARAENIRIKSFGLLSLLVLPGAFVEPDEKQLKKSKSLTKLKIFAAGTFSNLIVVLLVSLIMFGFITLLNNIFEGNGVDFKSTINGTPAHNVKLSGTILEVNDQQVKDLQSFVDMMNKIKPQEEIKITTSEGIFIFNTTSNPENKSKAFIGVRGLSTKLTYSSMLKQFGEPSQFVLSSIDWITNLLFWVIFLNLGVGMINILPIKPLDGGLMFEELFRKIFRKRASYLINILSIFTLILIVINIIGPSIVDYITSVFLISKFLIG